MKKLTILFCSLTLVLAGQSALAEVTDQGKLDYEESCAQCHGAGGEGNGYMASGLVISPPDLTSIKRRNGDSFPAADVYRLIVSGSWEGRVHVTGEMPLWGPKFDTNALSAYSESPIAKQIMIEREVHQRVSALVNYIYRLQVAAPEDLASAVAIIAEELPDIISLEPEAVEFVAVAPKGFEVYKAEAVVDLALNDEPHSGSGVYDLDLLAVRDLVGGQRQTSFLFPSIYHSSLADIFGNKEVEMRVQEAIESEEQGTETYGHLSFQFYVDLCLADDQATESAGFLSFHIRDRATGSKFYDYTLPIDVRELGVRTCG